MVPSSKNPPTTSRQASRQRDRPRQRRLRPGSPHHGGTPTSAGGSAGGHGVPQPLSCRSGTRHPLLVATQSRDVRGPAERSHPARARPSCPDSACAAGPTPRRQRAAAGALPRRRSRTSRPHFRVMWVLAPSTDAGTVRVRASVGDLQSGSARTVAPIPQPSANHEQNHKCACDDREPHGNGPPGRSCDGPCPHRPTPSPPCQWSSTTSWRRPPPRSPCNAVSLGSRASPHALAPRTGQATSAHAAIRAVLPMSGQVAYAGD